MNKNKELQQPFADPKRYTEIILQRALESDFSRVKRTASFKGDSYNETSEEAQLRCCLNILRANDFEARSYDEPVATIIFQGIEYNRPVRLGKLPIPDERFPFKTSGIWLSEEQKKQISLTKTGVPSTRVDYHHSEETRLKMSLAAKGRTPPNKGKKLSDEQKQKISIANKGKAAWNKGIPMSDETKKRLSEAKKGKPSKFKGVKRKENSNQ